MAHVSSFSLEIPNIIYGTVLNGSQAIVDQEKIFTIRAPMDFLA